MQLTTRNATFAELAALLTDQQGRKLDVVAPASALRSEGGVLCIDGTDVVIDADGVTPTAGRYVPTAVCDEGVADKLRVPLAYLRRMRDERPDLYDANVNGWLHGAPAGFEDGDVGDRVGADPRSFLVRCFRPSDGDEAGIARAFLSDKYGRIDHLDVLTAGLDGVRQAGAEVEIVGCDLTERRMRVRIAAPGIAALAPTLLRGYRSPFDQGGRRAGAVGNMLGAPGHEYEPETVFAGFELGNSETGGGAYTLTPRFIFRICSNGLTITADALRSVHLGSKMEDGVIAWSDDTRRKVLEVVTAKARDAVATFLSPAYLEAKIAELEAKAGAPVSHPAEAIKTIGRALSFTDEQVNGVLEHFIQGGQLTAAGVLNAVTSFAQVVEDGDEAAELEAVALRAFDLAVAAG